MKSCTFYQKLPLFIKNYPPLIKKLQMASREKTQTSYITLYKKTQFLEIIEALASQYPYTVLSRYTLIIFLLINAPLVQHSFVIIEV